MHNRPALKYPKRSRIANDNLDAYGFGMENGAHPCIELGESTIEGLGTFATAAFTPDDYIHTVEYEREVTDRDPLIIAAGERFENCAYPDGKIMLVSLPGRHMNHSCDPNAYYRYVGPVASAHALRHISIGE